MSGEETTLSGKLLPKLVTEEPSPNVLQNKFCRYPSHINSLPDVNVSLPALKQSVDLRSVKQPSPYDEVRSRPFISHYELQSLPRYES
jgi:hypothetical protein